jgi:hypothetical protein
MASAYSLRQLLPQGVADENPAAFAVAAGIRVVSFDQGFGKFDGVMPTE